MRFEQPVSVWKLGFVVYALQPLPPSAHALSAQPRGELDLARLVPPTPRTNSPDAGYSAP